MLSAPSATSSRVLGLLGASRWVAGLAFAACLLALGCGSEAAKPAASPDEAAKAGTDDAAAKEKAEAAKADAATKVLPTSCTPDATGLCAPPAAFVKHLCGGSFPDVALVMFGKDTPWSRGYLRRTMEAWNASGGASSNEKVVVDEEVLLLVHREANTGGMSIGGASGGSYEALRWDGTCVSLMAEEVTTRTPPKAKHSKIPWQQLDVKIREAFSTDEKLGPVVAEYRKECKGSFGEVSAKCEKVDQKLADKIVDHVRGGGSVPGPKALP